MPSTRTLQAVRNQDEAEWKSNGRFGLNGGVMGLLMDVVRIGTPVCLAMKRKQTIR